MHRIRVRDLYAFVGESLWPTDKVSLGEDFVGDLCEDQEHIRATVIVDLVRLDYGKGSRNPVDDITFFTPFSSGGYGIGTAGPGEVA